MTTRLETLRAELDAIEAAGQWDHPAHQWLCEQVERLEREEKSKPAAPAAAPATQQAGDPVAALVADMQAAHAHPERFTDQYISDLVSRYNAQVSESGRTAERIDMAQVHREMLTAEANPGALSDEQHADLLARYNAAVVQGPERRTTEVLRADLAGSDLGARMRAAEALGERGELDDATASEIVAAYNLEVDAAAERDPDVASLPPQLQDAAKAVYAAQAALEVPADPTEAALHQLDQAIRSMKPPTLAEQLEALGVQVEPDPEFVSSTTNAGEA